MIIIAFTIRWLVLSLSFTHTVYRLDLLGMTKAVVIWYFSLLEKNSLGTKQGMTVKTVL